MKTLTSKKLPEPNSLACSKAIYCQSEQAFYTANYGGGMWHWNKRSEEDVIWLVKQGWVAGSVPNLAEFLHNQDSN